MLIPSDAAILFPSTLQANVFQILGPNTLLDHRINLLCQSHNLKGDGMGWEGKGRKGKEGEEGDRIRQDRIGYNRIIIEIHLHFVSVKCTCVCLCVFAPGLVGVEVNYSLTVGPCQKKFEKHCPRESLTHMRSEAYAKMFISDYV